MQHSVSLSMSKIPLAASWTLCSKNVIASVLVKVRALALSLGGVDDDDVSDSSTDVLRLALPADAC